MMHDIGRAPESFMDERGAMPVQASFHKNVIPINGESRSDWPGKRDYRFRLDPFHPPGLVTTLVLRMCGHEHYVGGPLRWAGEREVVTFSHLPDPCLSLSSHSRYHDERFMSPILMSGNPIRSKCCKGFAIIGQRSQHRSKRTVAMMYSIADRDAA
jgi:hypothetical protein